MDDPMGLADDPQGASSKNGSVGSNSSAEAGNVFGTTASSPSPPARARRKSSRGKFRRQSFRLDRKSLVGLISSGAAADDGGGGRGERRRAPPSGTITIPEEGVFNVHEKFLTCPSLTEIRETFRYAMEGGNACDKADKASGKLLLHCIGLNRDLILLSTGGAAAAIARVDQFILRELLPAHPVAVIEEDDEGRIPFTEAIISWIQTRRAVPKWKSTLEKNHKQKDTVKQIVEKMGSKIPPHKCSSGVSIEPEYLQDALTDDKNEEDEEQVHDFPPLVEWSLRMLSSIIDRSPAEGTLGCAGSNISLQNEMNMSNNNMNTRSSSSSLSDLPDESDSLSGSSASAARKVTFRPSVASVGISVGAVFDEIIVEKVAAIPHLLEQLLMIEDSSARKRVFELSIVHKALFCPASLGDGKWLMGMLDAGIQVRSIQKTASTRSLRLAVVEEDTHGRACAEGAVFFLETLQSLNVQDDLHVAHHVRRQQQATGEHSLVNMVSNSDLQHFQKRRDQLYDRVGRMEGLIRTICVLDADLMARASNTQVVQRLLDKKIFSPFALSVAFFDGIAHIVMVLSFRLGPAPALFHMAVSDISNMSFKPHQYLFANMILMACIIWFATKEIQVLLAKHALSPRLFWSDALSFWTFLDVVPVVMAAVCAVAVDYALRSRAIAAVEDDFIPFYLRVAVALTTPLLWLRILAHIKMFNKQLATFILCSVEILKDIKWFLLVLIVAIASFAQMFVSLTYDPPDAQGILEGEVQYQHFSLDGYLKAYTIMLGDFDAASLKGHPSIVMLFILYTFGVTVVLLNILIAIVSESYVNAAVSSKLLLGEARVMFVAELLSLNLFHRLWMAGKTGRLRRNINLAFILFAALFTKLIVDTIKAKLQYFDESYRPKFTNIASASVGKLDFEAAVGFIVLFAVCFLLRSITVHIQSKFEGSSPVQKQEDNILSKSKFAQSAESIIECIYAYVGSKIDSLSDGDEKGVLKGSKVDAASAGRSRTDHRLHRALAATRKELKSEIKRSTDDVRLALREAEQKSEVELKNLEEKLASVVASAVATAMERSEERMIRTVMMMLDEDDSVSQSDESTNSNLNDTHEASLGEEVDEAEMHYHPLLQNNV